MMRGTPFWAFMALLGVALAGCTTPGGDGEDPAGGGSGFAPQQHHAEDAEAGLRAEGDLYECEEGLCVDARAWNDGDQTFHVSSICVPPWREEMTRDGERMQHREPVARCAAFGTEPFPPGAERVLNTTWDGRVWNGEGMEPAPQGAYVWRVTFHAYGEPDGAEPVELVLEFPVVVGAT